MWEPIVTVRRSGRWKYSTGLAALRDIATNRRLRQRAHAGRAGRDDRDLREEVGRRVDVDLALEPGFRGQAQQRAGTSRRVLEAEAGGDVA